MADERNRAAARVNRVDGDGYDPGSEERRSRRAYLWMVAVPVIALVVGWVIISQDDAGIGSARAKWEQAGLDDYLLSYRVLPVDRVIEVEVVGGDVELVSADPPTSEPSRVSIDRLFDAIEVAHSDGKLDGVVFHPELGYPLAVALEGDLTFAEIRVDPAA